MIVDIIDVSSIKEPGVKLEIFTPDYMRWDNFSHWMGPIPEPEPPIP